MTAELVLHLELDGFEVVNQKDSVKDSSGKNHVGELKGEVGIVADDAFGACADFDGDTKSYIEVPPAPLLSITGDLTVEAWAYFTKAATSWVRVIGKGTSDSRNYGLWYIMNGTTVRCLFQRGNQAPFDDCTVSVPAMRFNTWYHLAGVVDGTKSFLYIHDLKGKLIGEAKLANKSSSATLDGGSPITIGHSVFPGHAAHSGKIAHARIYRGARSQGEIEQNISSDRLALVPFRKGHPIDFRLYDENGQPALYIVDDLADAKITTLKLELTNSSTQSIQIPSAAETTGADNHHFALRFRPGTLSDSTKTRLKELTRANQANILTETAEWALAHDGKDPGPVYLFLSYKGPKKSLGPQEQLTLTLHGISADAGSGSRGTQVELIPRHLTYVDDDTPITGSRMRYLHIANQRGQKNIPLHVWLVNGNTVLNDGETPTKLTLRISNGSGDRDILLNGRTSTRASKFVISFDVGADWALTDKTRADHVKISQGSIELTRPGGGQEINDSFREWELAFPNQQVLAKRGSKDSESIEITLEGIKTKLPSGHANLYVRYENIPGYQDGQFILTVEKTPLVYDSKGNIAIGKSTQQRDPPKLDVDGVVVANGIATGNLGVGARLDIREDVVSNLTINKKIVQGGRYDYSAAPLSIFLPLEKHNGGSAPVGTEDILHLVREGVRDKAFGNKVSLAIGRYENDGLDSRTQLDIKLTDGHFADHKAVLSLRSNGYVGIGTPNPGTKLEIMDGSLQITASHNSNVLERDDAHIGTFYAKDKQHGIGISSNGIAAIGHTTGLQLIYLKPKGPNGAVMVEGSLRVDGGPFMVKGNIEHFGGDLKVQGPVQVNGSLEVSGPVLVKQKLQVDGSLIIHTEGVTNVSQAEAALDGRKHSIIFFVDESDAPHLNWGFVDGKGNFHKGWAYNT
jgi:Concanavalin A-like lectin/glucanases superfamily